MKTYGYLYEKVYESDNIDKAIKHVCQKRRNKKEVALFQENLEEYRSRMIEEIKNETYRVGDYTTFYLNERGKIRKIRKLPIYHACVLTAFAQICDPYIDRKLVNETHGSRKGRGMHSAITMLHGHLQNPKSNYVLVSDVHGFFGHIRSDIMKDKLRTVFKDPKVLRFYDNLIDANPDGEMPVGNRTSPALANLYLSDVLHRLKEKLNVHLFVNYVDNTVVVGFSKKWLHMILGFLKKYLAEIKLTLNPNYQVRPVEPTGVDFVGWVAHRDYILVRKKTKQRMKKAAKRIWWKIKTHREITYGDRCTISSYRGILKWCNGYNLYRKYLRPIVLYLRALDKREAYEKTSILTM